MEVTARDELAAIVRDWLADITSSTYADGSIFVEGAVDLDPYTIADAIIAAGWTAPEPTRREHWFTYHDPFHCAECSERWPCRAYLVEHAPQPGDIPIACQHPADRITQWMGTDGTQGGRCADCGTYTD